MNDADMDHPEIAAPTDATASAPDNQFDERIKASLSRRAESVRVEPDLVGLARKAEPRRSTGQRFPLVAVAVVIAALAVTTASAAMLLPASDRYSHVISQLGNQRDRTEDPTTTTSRSTSTSRPDRSSTTTTTTVPTTVPPPEGATPETLPGGAPDDGTGATSEPDPAPADPCTPVEGVIAVEQWEGDVLFVAEYGRNATLRHMTIWRDPGGDACPALVTEPGGERFGFSLPIPGGTPLESHTIRCNPPGFEFVDGYTDDEVTWRFEFRTYAVDDGTATLVEEHNAVHVEPAEHDTIEALRRTTCAAPGSGG